MKRTMKVLSEGTVIREAYGWRLPADAVIPAGFEAVISVPLDGGQPTFVIQESEGWRAQWLRWRYPYRPETP